MESKCFRPYLTVFFLFAEEHWDPGESHIKRAPLFCGRGFNCFSPLKVDNSIDNNLYLHYSGKREERRKKNKYRKPRKQNSRRFIMISCHILCGSIPLILRVNTLWGKNRVFNLYRYDNQSRPLLYWSTPGWEMQSETLLVLHFRK